MAPRGLQSQSRSSSKPTAVEKGDGSAPQPRLEESSFDCAGRATDGNRYATIADMWQNELAEDSSHAMVTPTTTTWYNKSEAYWNTQSASVEGMLGGLDALHSRDVSASNKFLSSIPDLHHRRRVLDVGAGIGRVSKHLLLPNFDIVDMLEQSIAYAKESITFLADAKVEPGSQRKLGRIGRRIVCGMQEFNAAGITGRDGVSTGPLYGEFDVIWIQWCVIYLTDDDLIAFTKECVKALKQGGVIVIKDNVARSGFLVDKDDSSVMRSDRYMRSLFTRAGVQVIKHARQTDFPKDVYPVRMYALRPLAATLPAGVTDSEPVFDSTESEPGLT